MIRMAVLSITLLLMAAPATAAMSAATPDTGEAILKQGDLAAAAEKWQRAAQAAEASGDAAAAADAWIRMAGACQALGHMDRAEDALQQAGGAVERTPDPELKARYYSRLGDLNLSLGHVDRALALLERAEDIATDARLPAALASLLINTGNAHAVNQSYAEAAAAYQESLALSRQSADAPDAAARAFINLARVHLRVAAPETFRSTLESALAATGRRADGVEKARDLIAIALMAMSAADRAEDGGDGAMGRETGAMAGQMDALALSALDGAGRIAEDLADPDLRSEVSGHLGGLYLRRGRIAEALVLTREALFYAQKTGRSPELIYQWQWRIGRLHAALGEPEEAADAYRRAIAALNPIRPNLSDGHRGRASLFDEKIKPVYLELARLLVDLSDAVADPERGQALLTEARDTMELLKTVELQDYFQDECVADRQTRTLDPETLEAGAAILYPIPFDDRVTVLATFSDGIRRFDAPVGADALGRTARAFRGRLQNSRGDDYIDAARQLYDWLILPLAPELDARGIHTLVVAPEGALRLIPFSTLRDGERFLIEKYTVVTVPAVTLTARGEETEKADKVILEGLSEARQGFASLPSVRQEIASIQSITGGKVLLNENYTVENLYAAFAEQNYNIVHMATHGVFGGSPADTYLLTHDSRLTMDMLEDLIQRTRRRGDTVDLLTLSACQTALGDERAAFGLAGIAVKAGVISAVASLWYADDRATSRLMTDFYTGLQRRDLSKAAALRDAQARMIGDPEFGHPAFWGPFLFIGNWM